MVKSVKHITLDGKASFYASILGDLKSQALKCGWALGLHGSLLSDMDLIAIAWTDEATTVEVMIESLLECFEGNIFNEVSRRPNHDKPHNRIVYTIHIFKDFYLDINVIKGNCP